MVKKVKYNFWVGLKKTAKNAAIFLLPSLVAWQASLPQEYAGLVSVVIYLIKNYWQNK